MSRTSWALVLVALFPAGTLRAQCASSGRSPGQVVGYNAIRLVLPSNMPSSAKTAFRAGMASWNDSSCNQGGDSFPRLQEEAAGAGRTVNVAWMVGLNSQNETSCANFSGNSLTLFTQTRVNGVVRPCDTAPIVQDNATHELGHLLGLEDQSGSCNQYAMGQTAFTSSGTYIDRTLRGSECQKVNETNRTPIEQQFSLCELDPTLPGCLGCVPDDSGQCHSPILLDLRNDGLHLCSVADGVSFDIDDDGGLENISWTQRQSEDAFLVLDRDENGTIDSGGELFGNYTRFLDGSLAPNGFLALFELDVAEGNGNGLIDPGDPVFGQLRLWRDRNHNGRSEQGELRTLVQAGVCAISTEYYVGGEVDEFGNFLRFVGSAWRCDPTRGWWRIDAIDVFFRGD